MRIVLDSNVWLDWLVFDDPRVLPIRQARRVNSVEIAIDTPCRDELERVLSYSQFSLDDVRQNQLMGEADRHSLMMKNLRYPPADIFRWCSDPDDIKFLVLSAACNADWLLTKDKALLSGRKRKQFAMIPFQIATPEQWVHATSMAMDLVG